MVFATTRRPGDPAALPASRGAPSGAGGEPVRPRDDDAEPVHGVRRASPPQPALRRHAAARPRRRGAVVRGRAAVRLPRRRASASTRPRRRWCGRRGTAPSGSAARSTATTPAASTGPATSSSTCPRSHTASVVGGQRAGWLRCRVVPAAEGYPFYSATPTIRAARRSRSAARSRPCTPRPSSDEVLGLSEGVPGQVFRAGAAGRSCRTGTPLEVEVAAAPGWERLARGRLVRRVRRPRASVFRIDRATGDVHFGPAVREPDGTLRLLRRRAAQGRAAAGPGLPRRRRAHAATCRPGTVRVLRSTGPAGGPGREPARRHRRRRTGDGRRGEAARPARPAHPRPRRDRRGLRAARPRRGARRSPGCGTVPADSDDEAGGVRVLVVPAASADAEGRLRFEDLVPTAGDCWRPWRTTSTNGARSAPGWSSSRRSTRASPWSRPLVARPRTLLRGAAARGACSPSTATTARSTGGPDGDRLAVRPAGPGGRGVRRPATAARHRAGRGGRALRRRPAHRQARRSPCSGSTWTAFALVFSYDHQIRVIRGG